jgi:hypothetical protein
VKHKFNYRSKKWVASPAADVFAVKKRTKSKAIPLQAWTDPEGPRRLRLADFKTVGT